MTSPAEDEDTDQDALAAEGATSQAGDNDDGDQDDLAAEWEAMVGDDDDEGGAVGIQTVGGNQLASWTRKRSTACSVSMRGTMEVSVPGSRRFYQAVWSPMNACRCLRLSSTAVCV